MNVASKRAPTENDQTPQRLLCGMIDTAINVAKKARKHGKSLNGLNFYANKLADLRADATVAFGRLEMKSVGDTTAVAELMQRLFSTDAPANERAQAGRDLLFAL